MKTTSIIGLVTVVGLTGLVGCSGAEEEPAQTNTTTSPETDTEPATDNSGGPGGAPYDELDDGGYLVRYTVRGIVKQLPRGDYDLMVQHEAIPEFRKGNGELGMNVMTMPFPLADGVSDEGMAVGDKVAITFEVRHAADWSLLGYETVSWTKLPDDTELNFTPLGGNEDEDGDDAGQ